MKIIVENVENHQVKLVFCISDHFLQQLHIPAFEYL